MVIAAQYTNGKQPTLDIATIENGKRAWVAIGIKVSGKREARKVAKEYDATPWNF